MSIYAFEDKVPLLGEDVFVAENAAVIGDVVLGAKSSVWFSAVLRGDMFPIRVGERVNVQDGAVIHVTEDFAATTVGNDVTIGHLALVHGCTIGNRVLIGMGSIILDRAVIEDECIIAAGTLVPPRMHIPKRSFVKGSPAKITREVTDEDLAMIDGGVATYQTYAKRFTNLRKV